MKYPVRQGITGPTTVGHQSGIAHFVSRVATVLRQVSFRQFVPLGFTAQLGSRYQNPASLEHTGTQLVSEELKTANLVTQELFATERDSLPLEDCAARVFTVYPGVILQLRMDMGYLLW